MKLTSEQVMDAVLCVFIILGATVASTLLGLLAVAFSRM